MKLHYERIWDYEIDEQEIIQSINTIKLSHFMHLSNTQLKHQSEILAKRYLELQIHNTDVSKLPHQLIKPIIILIYDELLKRKEQYMDKIIK